MARGGNLRRHHHRQAVVEISLESQWFTDELLAVFYACPVCGYNYVPHLKKEAMESPAKFCPGCGGRVKWTP